MKTRGHAILAKIRIVGLRDRVEGMADAELIVDGDRWVLLDAKERAALIDHELTHIEVVYGKDSRPKRDAHGRPKLRTKHHDYETGWFREVAERHGDHSQEIQQARAIFERERATMFSFVVEQKEQSA